MRRRTPALTVFVFIASAAVSVAADYYGLDAYRESLASEHGPFVSIPTHLGAALGAVVLMPISVVNGALSLTVFRQNPTEIVGNLATAPGRGWYWGGLIVGTPFRIVKGILWDVPSALIRKISGRGSATSAAPHDRRYARSTRRVSLPR